MGDFILTTGDQVIFDMVFGAAILVAAPAKLDGSGPGTINGKAMCVQGDEKKVSLTCSYSTTAGYMGGTGTLTIMPFAKSDPHVATMTKSGDKPVLLKGSTFHAQFEVQGKAMNPAILAMPADMTPMYFGMGQFVTTNDFFQGT